MCPCVPDHTPAAIAYGARLPGSSSTQPPISYSSDPSSAASASPSTPFPSRATDCSRRVPGGPICMHPLPDSDLTDAAAYDRLNRTTARKEKVLLDFVDHLAVCGIVSPHDLDNFERASLVLWRLTAVRKSLLAIHAQLDRPNPAPNNPRPLAPALQAAEEALNDVPFPDPAGIESASPAPDPATIELKIIDDDCVAFCSHYGTADCDQICPDCRHYPALCDTILEAESERYPELFKPNVQPVFTFHAINSAGILPASPSPSSPSPRSALPALRLDAPRLPSVPVCPSLAPTAIARTLTRVDNDFAILLPPSSLSSATPAAPTASPLSTSAATAATASGMVGQAEDTCPPAPPDSLFPGPAPSTSPTPHFDPQAPRHRDPP